MKKTVSLGQAVVASEAVLPPRVQEALGELVGVAREGLLALSVGVGLAVLAELMEEEVDEVVGAKGRHDVRRTSRNVKRWSSGEMAMRWTAAGMLEAERQFRRIIGYRDLARLVVAIEDVVTGRALPDPAHTPTEQATVVGS